MQQLPTLGFPLGKSAKTWANYLSEGWFKGETQKKTAISGPLILTHTYLAPQSLAFSSVSVLVCAVDLLLTELVPNTDLQVLAPAMLGSPPSVVQ